MNRHLLAARARAYAELGFPLLSGLLLGSPASPPRSSWRRPSCLFLANEPLVGPAGGARRRAQQSAPRRRAGRSLCSGAWAAAAGTAALWVAPPEAPLAALVPAGFAAGLVPVVLSRNLKTPFRRGHRRGRLLGDASSRAAAGGASGPALWDRLSCGLPSP